MIVLDASVLLDVLLQTTSADHIEERMAAETFHAPYLIDVEVTHVIRRYALAGEIESTLGRLAVQQLSTFPIRRYPHQSLLERMWELRSNLTAYDAAYVALAEVLDAPLLTRDRRLANAAGHTAHVEVI